MKAELVAPCALGSTGSAAVRCRTYVCSDVANIVEARTGVSRIAEIAFDTMTGRAPKIPMKTRKAVAQHMRCSKVDPKYHERTENNVRPNL